MGVIPRRLPSAFNFQPIHPKAHSLGALSWLPLGLLALLATLRFPPLIAVFAFMVCLAGSFPRSFSIPLSARMAYPNLAQLGRWRIIGILLGTLLFAIILTQANPALAQLFETAESEAKSTFGQYLDQDILTFLFSMMRIVIWVAAVGFVFFAVYQAQRGEQWQPLLQNAFIIIAAVVVVEGLSKLFFGA